MARSRYRRRQPPLHKRKPVQRSAHFLNYVPKESMFCIGPTPSEEVARDPGRGIHGDFTPLVCHRFFQDALDDEDIPRTQGRTRRGDKRNVRCEGRKVTDTEDIPYGRADGRPIYVVKGCTNFTKRRTWGGAGQGVVMEPEGNLAGLVPRSLGGKLLLGAGLYAALVVGSLYLDEM
jgi:hypothetical protein